MNKYEYLAQLRNALATLPKAEQDEAMSYYEEFFIDAGVENEQAVIASLGSPETLAASIIKESTHQSEASEASASASGFVAPETPAQTAQRTGKKWSGGQIALVVVLLILSFPIWIGIVAALFGISVGFICGAFGILIGLAGGSIGAIATGIIALFTNVPVGLFLIGAGLFVGGLMFLVAIPLCKLVIKLFKVIIKGIVSLINKISGKAGV